MRRIYTLDGIEINSHKVVAIKHVARKDKKDVCAACLEPILKNSTYYALLTLEPPIFHEKCFNKDHSESEDTIVGVSTKTIRRYGVKRTEVICKIVTLKYNILT